MKTLDQTKLHELAVAKQAAKEKLDAAVTAKTEFVAQYNVGRRETEAKLEQITRELNKADADRLALVRAAEKVTAEASAGYNKATAALDDFIHAEE